MKIAGHDPKFVKEHKALINGGQRLRDNGSFNLEKERSQLWNLKLTPTDLEKRN